MAQAQSIAPLPSYVVQEDHHLEKAANSSATALMKHRWHWTLNESNPKRVTLAAYARAVGRAASTISLYARGHEVSQRSASLSPSEALERARMSDERHEAARAVAEARQISIASATKRHDEVREVRSRARERAEAKGTTTAEEARKVAGWNVKAEKARERERQDKREHHGLQWVKTEGKLQDMKRKGIEVIDAAIGAEFDREERDLLLHTVGEVQEVLQLARTAIAGKAIAEKKLEVLRGGLSA